MAADRWNWLIGCAVLGAVLLGTWFSRGVAQEPFSEEITLPVPARPLAPAQPAPRMVPAERMKPLTPLVPFQPQPDAASEQITGCIVQGNGVVTQGAITEWPEAYHVRTQTGAVLVIPFAKVRTVAESLEQAYQQMREAYDKPSAGDHIDLGRWCEQYQLFEEASTEAQAALILEPTRKDALALLKRSEAALGRTSEAPVDNAAIERPQPASVGVVVSAESQGEFSRHIQRIALNKCGNGGCHGASALSPFKLTRGPRSEQNMQTMLKYIDTQTPADSPLLVKARSVDGPHAGLFSGGKGSEQYAKLLAWVEKVVAEQNNPAGIRRRPPERREGGPVITIRPRQKQDAVAAEEPDQPHSTPRMSLDNAPEIDINPQIKTASAEEPALAPRRPREAPLKSAALKKLLDSQEPDAFDPEEFNRLVHGNGAGGKE